MKIYMKLRKKIKRLLKSNEIVYYIYTKIRYRNKSKIRDWIINNLRFIDKNKLNSIVFEEGSAYVRLQSGQEFRYLPEYMGGLLGLEYKTGFETDDIRTLLSILPKDPVVIDVGANFGIYAVLCAQLSDNAKVHAFEPVSKTVKILYDNVIRNAVQKKITINEVGVGEKAGITKITSDRYAGNHFLKNDDYDGEVEQINVVSLDDYVQNKKLNRIDLIKCDVEGGELFVMKGAVNIIKKFKPMVMLEINEKWTRRLNYSSSELINFMIQLDYKYISMSALSEKLENTNTNTNTKFHTENYLFFHMRDKINELIN